MKIFSGTSNKPLALALSKNLGLRLSELEIFIFPDGERRVRVLDKVIGENTFVVQSTCNPTDQNYMELFFIIDALKRSGAKSVTAIIPYLGYQRQDHVFREGEAVSVKVIAEILENIGTDKVIAIDLHSMKIEESFNIPIFHLSALSIFARFIKEKGWDHDNTGLVSPDMGGIRRIKMLSKMLGGMPFAVIQKNRDLASGKISAEKVEGTVGKRAIIIDDMISSGGTIVMAANLLKKKGAEEIMVFETHPVFSEKASKNLQESELKEVYVTDTIYVPKEKRFEKLNILSVAALIAKNIDSSRA